MDLEHSFTVPVPTERAWQVLLDVEQVAPCMPGATVESVAGEVITGRIKVKVGPVMLTYAGSARFTQRDDQARTVTLEASGKETRGAGTASATVRSSLRDEGGQTRVTVNTTLNVTGRPAQFGRGVMAEVGGKIIEKFASNLAAHLSTAGQGEALAPLAPGGAGAATAETAPAPGSAAAPGAEGAGAEAAPSPPGVATADQPIDDLRLPVRAYNSLRREGVLTVADLCARTEAQLLAISNVGPAAIREIKHKLADRGLNLAEAAAAAPPAAITPGEPAAAIPPAAPVPPILPAEPAAAIPSPEPGAPGAGPAGGAAPPRGPRPPDEEAIDLLSVAGFPVLKRVLPVLGGVAVLLGIAAWLRRRRNRAA